jgi:hypothetical protein
VALLALLLGACSDGSSNPPTTPATTPAPPTTMTTSPSTVATTAIPFPRGINGPIAPGPTEPASR